MKVALFIILLLSFVVISSLYISEEDGSLDKEFQEIKHEDISPLKALHVKFSKLNIHSQDIDLDKALEEVHLAIQKYPLDDKLKMIKIELENRRANQANNSTKNPTPDN